MMKPVLITLLVLAVAVIVSTSLRQSRMSEEKLMWEEHDSTLADLDQEQRVLAVEIKNSGGTGACDRDSECALAGLGAAICGKRSNYFIYSKKDVQADRFFPAVERFNANAQKMNDLSLNVPSCGMDPDPVRCVDGRCSTGNPNP